MKIAVIGAGSVGSGIGKAWSKAGHTVTFGVRNPDDPKTIDLLTGTSATADLAANAAQASDVIVLALPWHVAEDAVKALGDLSGKIIIDAMNPLAMGEDGLGLDRGFTTSAGEEVASWVPGAFVVKSLNQTGAEVMADTSGFAHKPVMFVASDHGDAKKTAAALIEDLGFEVLDAGNLKVSRILEPFAMVWINQALKRGKGRDWTFAAVERSA